MTQETVRIVYEFALQEVKQAYGSRLLASYLIGSLSHGSFSTVASDIDVAFILSGKIEDSDWLTFGGIDLKVKESGLQFAPRISIFWSGLEVLKGRITSGAFPTPYPADGLFPPFDVLDLQQNGQLIYGTDVRNTIRVPSENDLYIAGVEFLLSYVREQTEHYLEDAKAFMHATSEKKSKIILFPVRLLYTLRTQKVGNNSEAVEYALAHEYLEPEERELIAEAMRVREGFSVNELLLQKTFPGIRSLYVKILRINAEKMKQLGKHDYADTLAEWINEIENTPITYNRTN